MSERLLVLLRHGQSEWNLKNLFTGWKDPDLTEHGVEEAKDAGRKLKAQGLAFDLVFTSALIRAQHTLDLMLAEMGQTGLPTKRIRRSTSATMAISPASTRTMRARSGARSRCMIWRRSYDVPPPGGESLKDTVARALPYYVQNILPRVLGGERVLVAAHGNSLRALVMVLERLTPEAISKRSSRPACHSSIASTRTRRWRQRSIWRRSRHSGAMRSIEPGISRFRVWPFGPSRNDVATNSRRR